MIVGASYIALEFAQMFRRFGSHVTVLVRGERVLTREDADFAERCRRCWRARVSSSVSACSRRASSRIGAGVRIMLRR